MENLIKAAREVTRLHAIYAGAKDLSWSQYMTNALDDLSEASRVIDRHQNNDESEEVVL